MRIKVLRWPVPYRCAFAITDDPDQSTTERVRVIYEFCLSLGIRPTRGTWVLDPRRTCGLEHRLPPDAGVSLEDPEYRALSLELASRGVEFGLHGVTSGDNLRAEVQEGLDRFRECFGYDPRVLCFHKHNAENLHWGEAFFVSRLARRIVRFLVPTGHERYEGSDENSPYFCGDLVRDRVKYVRLFRTLSLDVLSKNPSMPFHLVDRPYVSRWFSAVAQDLVACRRITRRSLDRLARRDGLLLLYAHMAEHFVDSRDEVVPEVRTAFTLIAKRKDVWLASVGEVLDRCLAMKNLLVVRTRCGAVISNPTRISLSDVQLAVRSSQLFLAGGESLLRVRDGLFVLPRLAAFEAVPLFSCPRQARASDPRGISPRELFRMLWEEALRMVVLRGHYRGIRQRLVPIERLRDSGISS